MARRQQSSEDPERFQQRQAARHDQDPNGHEGASRNPVLEPFAGPITRLR